MRANLICISGKARSGKDTLADFLIESLSNRNKDAIKIAYADNLKKKLMVEFNLSWEQVYGNLKEEVDKRFRKKLNKKDNYEDGKVWEEKDLYWTPREIMQFIGTDCYREVDDNFWVNSLFKNLEEVSNYYDYIIIPDCRFKSEIEPVVRDGGHHIHIYRKELDEITNPSHSSENLIVDNDTVDFFINNDGTLDDLKNTAEDIIDIIEKTEFSLYKKHHAYGFSPESGLKK